MKDSIKNRVLLNENKNMRQNSFYYYELTSPILNSKRKAKKYIYNILVYQNRLI